jgi:hypothetical protein
VELYLHFLIRLLNVVLNYLNTGTTLLLPYSNSRVVQTEVVRKLQRGYELITPVLQRNKPAFYFGSYNRKVCVILRLEDFYYKMFIPTIWKGGSMGRASIWP